ncbi:MAG: BMP family ABC transporter substrate-binding protein [Deltaproteobacteria bacterium]|nr:BMP family ABC transporter substrate-binding protein [Deltaproteobacteria bacterium]
MTMRPELVQALRGVLLATLFALAACGGGTGGNTGQADDFTLGMILVGAQDDHGWSQAHYEAGRYVVEQLHLPADALIVVDRVNPADRPGTTIESVVDDMVARGAQLVFATSDDMKDGIEAAAAAHPDVAFVWSSGDSAWPQGANYRADLTNLGNIMGRMEYGKMIAGCAAALTTQTGAIGYLGPLINDETRRLVNSAYLGARYCYQHYRGQDPDALRFEVQWIGFWFNVPGVTRNPTAVTDELFAAGADVVISGLDTTEALRDAAAVATTGAPVWAVPYNFAGACAGAPRVCLGVPYFNWGPAYLDTAQSVIDARFAAKWQWLGPDWAAINDRRRTAVGWRSGQGLSADATADVTDFIAALGAGAVQLYVGPLDWQDGLPFLADGEHASDVQIWYARQLLKGIIGVSH